VYQSTSGITKVEPLYKETLKSMRLSTTTIILE